MKKTLNLGLILSLALLFTSLANAQTKEKAEANEVKSVKLKVTGLTCAGCASHLYKVLSETPGVIENEVKYPGDITVVKYDASKINPEEIIKSIEEKTRYTAELSQEKDKKKDKT